MALFRWHSFGLVMFKSELKWQLSTIKGKVYKMHGCSWKTDPEACPALQELHANTSSQILNQEKSIVGTRRQFCRCRYFNSKFKESLPTKESTGKFVWLCFQNHTSTSFCMRREVQIRSTPLAMPWEINLPITNDITMFIT